MEAVQEEFAKSGGTYASPKIWITLVRQGRRVSSRLVARTDIDVSAEHIQLQGATLSHRGPHDSPAT
ncbi:transposase [Streptomyces sp. NPDC058892]|uniref:transposase n=1 Tax=unclassified Streptomyces TaxID=2593676 RepID=UPI0036C351F3